MNVFLLVVLILLAVFILLYCISGSIVRYRGGIRGVDVIPHLRFWREVFREWWNALHSCCCDGADSSPSHQNQQGQIEVPDFDSGFGFSSNRGKNRVMKLSFTELQRIDEENDCLYDDENNENSTSAIPSAAASSSSNSAAASAAGTSSIISIPSPSVILAPPQQTSSTNSDEQHEYGEEDENEISPQHHHHRQSSQLEQEQDNVSDPPSLNTTPQQTPNKFH